MVNLKEKRRIKLVDKINKPESVYDSEMLGNVLTLLFVGIDLACLYSVWNGVQTENPITIMLIAIGCAVCLDIPLAIAAHAFAAYKQGISNKSKAYTILIISVVLFVIAFVFTLVFRVINKDVFDTSSASGLVNTMNSNADIVEQGESDTPKIMIAALFTGVLPLLTSLASFVVNYFSAKPLDKKIAQLKKSKITYESIVAEYEAVLEESETAEGHCSELMAREKDVFEAEKQKVYTESEIAKQNVRLEIMKKIQASPETITQITEESKKLINKNDYDVSNSQLLSYVKKLTEVENRKGEFRNEDVQ